LSIIGTIVALLLIASFIYDGYLAYKATPETQSTPRKCLNGLSSIIEEIVACGWVVLGFLGTFFAIYALIFGFGG